MIRVLICDDQEVVRRGLHVILTHADGIEVVGTAANGQQAFELVETIRPDVILMDLKMPIMNGVVATRKIREAYPDVRVLVLTTYDADEWVFDALRGGASGYLLKDADSDELIKGIKACAAGKTPLDPQIAGTVVTAFTEGTPRSADPASLEVAAQFTEREITILQLMAQGKSNQEIADTIFLAAGTVKNNVSNIIGKFGVNDRTQAVIHALKLGIVHLD